MFLSLSDDVPALFDKQNVNMRVFDLVLQREWEESFFLKSKVKVVVFSYNVLFC